MNIRHLLRYITAAALILILLLLFSFIKKNTEGNDVNAAVSMAEETAPEKTQLEGETEPEDGETHAATGNDGTVEEEAAEPLTDEALTVRDVYAPQGGTAAFKAYYPDAEEYSWETYDMASRSWGQADADDVSNPTDELNRHISVLRVPATLENDRMMVRCTTRHGDGSVTEDEAFLNVIEGITGLKAEPLETAAGNYISIDRIPVLLTFEDGTEKEVTGLSGLYFATSEESTDLKENVDGTFTETVTRVITEGEYMYIGLGDTAEAQLRYRGPQGGIEASVTISGTDNNSPVISDVSISDFQITNADVEIPVTVKISAEDDTTPYPLLRYAFVPDGTEPSDDDWHDSGTFDVGIFKNGKWTAYCEDESGNKGTFDKYIIAVDQKAPSLSVRLQKNDDEWCTENVIFADASDTTTVSYSFSCTEQGIDTGWIQDNQFRATMNGIYTVTAMDEAGNTSTEDITVSNIDNQKPVILGIREITEGDQQ
jgi:hypothetical protein